MDHSISLSFTVTNFQLASRGLSTRLTINMHDYHSIHHFPKMLRDDIGMAVKKTRETRSRDDSVH